MVDLVERDKSGFGGRPDGGGAPDLMPGIKEAGDDRSLEIKIRHQLTASTYSYVVKNNIDPISMFTPTVLNYCESFSELHQKVSACLKWRIIT